MIFSDAQLSSVSSPGLPLAPSTTRTMHRDNRANDPTTYLTRRNRTRRQLVQRWKRGASPAHAVQKPTTWRAHLEDPNDELSVTLRLHGEAAASGLIAYYETRDRVARMLRTFVELENAHAETIMVLEDSVACLQAVDSRLSLTSVHKHTEIDKREALLVVLREDAHKLWAAKESFRYESHIYRKLVKHSVVDQTTLSPETSAVQASFVVLRLKASQVLQGARQAMRSFQLFQRNVDYSNLSQGNAQALAHLKRGIGHHGDMMIMATQYITDIANTLRTVSLLEKDIGGVAHAHVDMMMRPWYSEWRKLDQIRQWAYKRSPLVQSRIRKTSWRAMALKRIDKYTDALLIDGLSRLTDHIRDVRDHLLAGTKARLEGPGAFSPLAAHLRRIVVDGVLESYKHNQHTHCLRHLRLWGYKASKPPSTVHLKIRKWNVGRRLRIQKFIARHRARMHFHESKDPAAKSEARKRIIQDQAQASRHQIRSERKQSLEKIRRLLVSSLLPFDEQPGTRVNKSSPSATPSGFLIPSKTSPLGTTCSILGFGGARDSHSRTLPGGKIRTITKGWSEKSTKTGNPQPAQNAVPSTSRLVFKPSPQLLAPQSTCSFSETGTSQSTSSYSGEGVDENANDDVHDRSTGQGPNGPHHNPPERPTDALPNPISKGNSDPDHPSDSESESASDSESESESETGDVEEEYIHVPLSYQIPPDTLLAATQALPNTRASYWSHQFYRGPNEEIVSVHYCRKLDVAERVAKYFLEEKVVGFDMEWKPNGWPTSIKQNASLIQIACEDRIALFHVALFAGNTPAQLVPPSLRTILESPDIYKVGVNIKGDFTRLEKHLGIQAQGILELSRIHNLVERPQAGHRLCKLSVQVQQHLLLPLYKGEVLVDEVVPSTEESTAEDDVSVNDNVDDKDTKTARSSGSVRESDWSKPLDRDQIYYAADDVYAGFRLYDVLEHKRKMMKPVPPLPRLCDDDPATRPSASRRPKVASKPKVDLVKVVNEAMGTMGEEDSDTQEYETALEELEDDDGVDDSDPNDEASNADYIPKRLAQRPLGGAEQSFHTGGRPPRRGIGRAELSKLTNTDPGYPTLPTSSLASEDSDSDDSDAFDPAPVARPRRAVHASVVAQTSSEQDDAEYTDPELENALMEMNIDRLSDIGKARNPEPTTEQEDLSNREIPATNKASTNNAQPEALDVGTHDPPQPTVTIPMPVFNSLIPDPKDTLGTPEFIAATLWAQSYLKDSVPALSPPSSLPAGIRATIPHLRAYYLWHHMRIPLEEIGAHLKEPPLAQSTVSSHILQAVSLERLECEHDMLQAVLETVPQATRAARWGSMYRRVSGAGSP
jgi:hypothetical protein